MKTLVFEYDNHKFRAYIPNELIKKDSKYWNLEPPADAAISETRSNFIIKNIIWNFGLRKNWDVHRREHPTYGDLAGIVIDGFNYKNAELCHMVAAIIEDLSKTDIFKDTIQYGTPLNPKNPRDREYIRRSLCYEEEIGPQQKCWGRNGLKDPFEE